jgi:hypothetical protein
MCQTDISLEVKGSIHDGSLDMLHRLRDEILYLGAAVVLIQKSIRLVWMYT